MSYDYVKKIAEELADQHPAKFLFLFEKPEFKCWFIGRIDDLCEKKVNRNIINAVLLEMMG